AFKGTKIIKNRLRRYRRHHRRHNRAELEFDRNRPIKRGEAVLTNKVLPTPAEVSSQCRQTGDNKQLHVLKSIDFSQNVQPSYNLIYYSVFSVTFVVFVIMVDFVLIFVKLATNCVFSCV